MEHWRKDARKEAVITDIDTLVPKDHLLRKIERVMDYEWLYERLDPYHNHEVSCSSIDPVVLGGKIADGIQVRSAVFVTFICEIS